MSLEPSPVSDLLAETQQRLTEETTKLMSDLYYPVNWENGKE